MAERGSSCKYHPESPARWHCPDCNILYCTSCIQPNERNEAFCPVCELMLEKQEFGVYVQPFWQRMPATFLYPLQSKALIFLVIMSAASLLQLVPVGGVIAVILLPFILMKYAFQILQSTAVGHMAPPLSSTSMHGSDFALPLKSYFILIFIGVFVGLASQLGLLTLIIALLMMALLYPAMVMVLGVTRKFFQAFNPFKLIEMIRMIGSAYLGLTGMILLLYGSAAVLTNMIASSLPNSFVINMTVFTFITSYYTLVMFHLMGYILYQFHENLGIQVETHHQATNKKDNKPIGQSPLSKVRILLQEGHLEIAKPFIAKHLKNEVSAEQMQLHDLYIKILHQQQESVALKDVGKIYIFNLMEHGHAKKALQTFRLCHEVDATFRLDDAKHTDMLIQTAYKASDYELVLLLANNFAKKHPDYVQLFEIYLRVAGVLHEHFKRAKMMLARIVRSQAA